MAYHRMTDTIVSVFVEGTPVPQGSMRAGRQGQLYYSNSAVLKPWRKLITSVVAAALPEAHEPIDGPIKVSMIFYFPNLAKPKPFKLSAPDVDKLTRAVLDGITDSKLYYDDSRVVWIDARKKYVTGSQLPGVHIEVSEISDGA